MSEGRWPFYAVIALICMVFAPLAVQAQTKAAKGIMTGRDAISTVVPEIQNLEDNILDAISTMEAMEQCGGDSRFIEDVGPPVVCRTLDPVDITFTSGANRRLRIQHPTPNNDGSYPEENYPLNGADGQALNVPPPPTASATCALPWGGSINENDEVEAWQQGSVPFGGTCRNQMRRCQSDGTLTGTYTNRQCNVAGAASCTSPWNTTVNHTDFVTAYQSATVPNGQSCVSERRTCDDGDLGGSYTHRRCDVEPAGNAGCDLPWGGTIAHDETVMAYSRERVNECLAACETCMDYAEMRRCTNGRLSGSYTIGRCNTISPCMPCFTPETLITLADGSRKMMKHLNVGDKVKGETQVNTVVKVPNYDKHGKIYSFNGGRKFVTAGHPFKTPEGWKAIDPSMTSVEGHSIKTNVLKVGDKLILENGAKMTIESIEESEVAERHVYNPMMDGDHTYYADGYLVHNKQVTECRLMPYYNDPNMPNVNLQ